MVWNAVLVKAGMQGTVPKVGALALRLRSSGIPTTHTTHAAQWREHRGDKMKQIRLPPSMANAHRRNTCTALRLYKLHRVIHGAHSSHSTEERLSEASLRTLQG